MHQDYLDLLQCLNEKKVKYLVIGGYAVIHYATPRYTKDLDLWIEASAENAKKVLKALSKFGAPIDNLSIQELSKPGLIYVFGIPPIRVDILNGALGCRFLNAWKNKNTVKIESTNVHIISKAELLKLKKKAGRAQDKADIEALKK